MISFTPKNWINKPNRTTPLDEAAIENLEVRVTNYAEDYVNEANGVIIHPEDFGAGVGIESTEGIQAAIDEGFGLGNATILFQPGNYIVDAEPRTDRNGNSIISLTHAALFSTSSLTLQGAAGEPGAGSGRTTITTTRTGDTMNGSGPPSVIGGATIEQSPGWLHQYSGPIRIKGIKMNLPADPDLAGIDLRSAGGFELEHVAVFAIDNGVVPTTPHAFGIRTCSNAGGALHLMRNCMVHNMYGGFVMHAPDHMRLDGCIAYKCAGGLLFEDPTRGGHAIQNGHVMIEHCPVVIGGWDATTGVKSIESGNENVFINNLNLELERGSGVFQSTTTVLDANNKINATLNMTRFTGSQVTDPGSFTGGKFVEVKMPLHATPNVASATTVTLPAAHDTFKLTGTTSVTSITASWPNRRVTLINTSTAQLVDGGNLRLASNGPNTADDTITLVCDGTNWFEVTRSVN